MENKIIKDSAAELLVKLGQADQEKEKEIINVINKHSLIAAAAGWVPIPFVDIALVVGNVWTMYATINKVIGLSFSDNMLKSIGSGVVANLSTSIEFGNPLLIKLLNEYKQEGHQGKQIYKISYFDYIIPYKCLKRICKYSLLLLFSEVINGYLSLEKFLPMVESFTKMYFYGGNDDLIGKLKKNLFNFNKY